MTLITALLPSEGLEKKVGPFIDGYRIMFNKCWWLHTVTGPHRRFIIRLFKSAKTVFHHGENDQDPTMLGVCFKGDASIVKKIR